MHHLSVQTIAKASAICACLVGAVQGTYISKNSHATSTESSEDDRAIKLSLNNCPLSCQENDATRDWTVYHSIEQLAMCRDPIVFDFAADDELDPTSPAQIRACSTRRAYPHHFDDDDDDENSHNLAGTQIKQSLEIATTGRIQRTGNDQQQEALVALQTLLDFMTAVDGTTTTTTTTKPRTAFSYYQGVVAGAHAGSSSANRALLPSASRVLADELLLMAAATAYAATGTVAQLCGEAYDADSTLGVAVSSSSPHHVRNAVQSWSEGMCALGFSPSHQVVLGSGSDESNSSQKKKKKKTSPSRGGGGRRRISQSKLPGNSSSSSNSSKPDEL